MGVTVITGEGKGKTTGALGLALLALASGQGAAVVQFLKGNSYAGELFAAQRAGIKIYQFGWGCHWSSLIRSGEMHCTGCGECFRQNRKPEHGFALKALEFARRLADSGEYGLLVLDEVSHALRRGLLQPGEVAGFIAQYRERVDLVLTGRDMAAEIAGLADAVYDLKAVRHPLGQGIKSRRGIEY